MAVLGASEKAATLLLPGRTGNNYGYDIAENFGAKKYSYTGGSGNQNAINITGSGVWTFGIMYKHSSGGSGNNAITVIIDGVTVLSDSASGDMQNVGMIQVGIMQYYPGQTGLALSSRGHVPFNTSLRVQMSSNDNTAYAYNYYLT